MSKSKIKSAITPTRDENFPEWYQQAVKAGELAEASPVRGCMVIKPWGYGIWERMQAWLNRGIKAEGVENAYFPIFIPLSFLEKEAAHVKGFAKECAVVTHHRLEQQGEHLVPAGELEEPLVVRPTSETIVGDSFSRWVQSYRDLPLKINQWANVVRWEMRTRLFLRTAEFLWQEGHTVHSTAEEARSFSLTILELYRQFAEEVLAIPVLLGEKSPGERFPGAEATYTFEAMMQDRKALQMGTSHYLGQNFSKAQDITFSNQEGELEHGYTTSWGVTTRMIGALVMVHGDDDGIRLPPRIAPHAIVILPVIPKEEMREAVMAYAEEIASRLREQVYHGEALSVIVDSRDLRGGEKSWQWIKKGIPLRVEVGPRDIEARKVVLTRRDRGAKEKSFLEMETFVDTAMEILDEIQAQYLQEAKSHLDGNIVTDIGDFEALKAFFSPKNENKPGIHGGFVRAKWCGLPETEELLAAHKLTIRCIPFDQTGTTGNCILTGKEATTDAIFAKSY
jgi:prolyl-tRNA synthetase